MIRKERLTKGNAGIRAQMLVYGKFCNVETPMLNCRKGETDEHKMEEILYLSLIHI